MGKRFSKQRSKGRQGRLASQRRQKLSKEVRELYPELGAGGAADLEALEQLSEAWSRRPAPASHTPDRQPGKAPEQPEPTAAGGALEALREGRVVAIASGLCRVAPADGGDSLECVLPSALAARQQSSVAVGDRVLFGCRGDGPPRVEEVLPRRTVLARPDPQNPRLERVIAANVDVVVIVVSLSSPPLRVGLVDRYLIAVERGGARPLLVVNKLDAASDEERKEARELLEPYRQMGLEVLFCSALEGRGLDDLRAALAGRTAVFTGHSGVGKSSLLNALGHARRAEVGAVSDASGKGRHTTTGSRLYRLEGGVEVIDTPGIRELGLGELDAARLRYYFPDFLPHAAGCRFNDCSHSHEPGCAVRAAVEAGELAASRYATYRRILDSLEAP